LTTGVVTVGRGRETFECPPGMRNHVERVFQGEYEIAVDFDKPPRVLDIGANCGAFAIWAGARWETERLTCYEPHPETFRTLSRNLLKRSDQVKLIEAAVVGAMYERDHVELYPGLHNCGESSLFNLGEQDMSAGISVAALRAGDLPRAEIVKIDAEGAELEILRGLDLRDTVAVLLEWHSADDRRALDGLMTIERGYDLVGGFTYSALRGVMKFVRP
jgi:FkbM family methyltransferase